MEQVRLYLCLCVCVMYACLHVSVCMCLEIKQHQVVFCFYSSFYPFSSQICCFPSALCSFQSSWNNDKTRLHGEAQLLVWKQERAFCAFYDSPRVLFHHTDGCHCRHAPDEVSCFLFLFVWFRDSFVFLLSRWPFLFPFYTSWYRSMYLECHSHRNLVLLLLRLRACAQPGRALPQYVTLRLVCSNDITMSHFWCRAPLSWIWSFSVWLTWIRRTLLWLTSTASQWASMVYIHVF